jgi:hypothetical protein
MTVEHKSIDWATVEYGSPIQYRLSPDSDKFEDGYFVGLQVKGSKTNFVWVTYEENLNEDSCAVLEEPMHFTIPMQVDEVSGVCYFSEGGFEAELCLSDTDDDKPTDWRYIKEGTPVLFRRTKDSEYEAGRCYRWLCA